MTHRYVHWDGDDVPVLSYDGPTLATPRYLHPDHQGSIVAISSASGVGQINRYDEYGIPAATNAGRFQYTGQAWLAELGLYYYKARLYSPTLGRFLQIDPVGYQGGLNLYGYVNQDPVNYVDSDGHQGGPVRAWVTRRAVEDVGGYIGGFLRWWGDRISDATPEDWLVAAAATGLGEPDRTQSEAITEDVALGRLIQPLRQINRTAIMRGCCSEARVLQSLGLQRNTMAVRTAEGVAVPDALTTRMSVEVKDAAVVSLTRQLRIQIGAAHASGRQAVLVTGTHTRLTGQARDAFDRIVRRSDLGPQVVTRSRIRQMP